MTLSNLIKYGYLEDTKKGYVVKKNFNLNDVIGELDKTLIIPDYAIVDLTGDNSDLIKFNYSGKCLLFVSGEKK